MLAETAHSWTTTWVRAGTTIHASPRPSYCLPRLTVLSGCCRYGVTDMALGFRPGIKDTIRDGISFWVQTLKQCARNDKSLPCYGRENIADMYAIVAQSKCPSSPAKQFSLSETNFAFFFIVIFLMGPLFLVLNVVGLFTPRGAQHRSPLVSCASIRWRIFSQPSAQSILTSKPPKSERANPSKLLEFIVHALQSPHLCNLRAIKSRKLETPGELDDQVLQAACGVDFSDPSHPFCDVDKEGRRLQRRFRMALEAYYLRTDARAWMFLRTLHRELLIKWKKRGELLNPRMARSTSHVDSKINFIEDSIRKSFQLRRIVLRSLSQCVRVRRMSDRQTVHDVTVSVAKNHPRPEAAEF
jgi:hypothetical protein